jgi:hypothetical protein
MRKPNQTNKLKLNTETIRLLNNDALALVAGGSYTTTYRLSQGCGSQSCLTQYCLSQGC